MAVELASIATSLEPWGSNITLLSMKEASTTSLAITQRPAIFISHRVIHREILYKRATWNSSCILLDEARKILAIATVHKFRVLENH
jgi:hypothetical protein